MGKNNQVFVKKRSEKRKKFSLENSFSKKRKASDNIKVSKNIVRKKEMLESLRGDSDNGNSDNENPFKQLVNSFAGASDSKYLSSSDSEIENNDVNEDIEKADSKWNSDSSNVDEDTENVSVEDDQERDSSMDPFEIHFQRDLSNQLYEIISTSNSNENTEEITFTFPVLGKCIFDCPRLKNSNNNNELYNSECVIDLSDEKGKIYAEPGSLPTVMKNVNWNNLHVKSQIHNNIYNANLEHVSSTIDSDKLLTPLQKELFSVINKYQDLYYPNRTLDNGEEIRFIFCLHAINHALKTRLKVIHHNARLSDNTDVPDDFRDQGLIRPKVLIILPFRESALRVIKIIMSILLCDEKANVVNKKRFFDEFSGGEIAMPHKNPKPIDYEKTFGGNADDNFRIGISVTKKSLKLYADFYSSDIIIASPLGLRLIVGAEGEAERDFDFLASIEVLILDQTEIFLMQNWDHLLHILDHLHLQPQQSHGTDFSRVRNWALNGWTRYYRQTLIFSSGPLPLITALFIKNCKNYAGKVTVSNPIISGSVCQVAVKVPQVFCRIESTSSVASVDKRFTYFITEILPPMKDPFMKRTLIFVPSYLDYVMIRNYFKKETISFVQICEYSKDGKIARARDKFFHGESHFLLYSERFHFFRRIRVKGIRHIIFYQPPTFPHFYHEMCNLIQDDKDTVASITTLYTKYDLPQLAAIVGTDRANRILQSENSVHRIVAK